MAFGFPRSFQEFFSLLFQDQGQGPPIQLWLSSYPAGFSKWLLRKFDSSQDSATRPKKTKGRSCGKEENGTITEPQDWPTQRVSERLFDGKNKEPQIVLCQRPKSSRIATQREANLNLQFSEDDSDTKSTREVTEVIAQCEVLEGTISAEANEVRPAKFQGLETSPEKISKAGSHRDV